MKLFKVVSFVIVASSLLLSACSAANVPTLAPVANTTDTAAPSAKVLPVSAPISTQAQTQAQTAVGSDVLALQNAYEAVYEKVNPSVVTIQVSQNVSANTRSRSTTPGQTVPTAEGSGFVWDVSGHIVTNNHVVEGADKINVTFADGQTADAKLVGSDPNSDLAVIQVSVNAAQLKPVEVADSNQARVGQIVVAIGNPFGQANTMTTGIVSALARTLQVGNNSQTRTTPTYSIPDVIQTDTAINPGNSGGVLVDLDGRLLGVPSAIESTAGTNSGVGFAIPSAIVKKVVPSLIASGRFEHAWLGVTGGTLTSETASALNLKAGQRGVVVSSVTADGPAAKAGLKAAVTSAQGTLTAADVIVAFEGKPVTRFEDLVSYLFSQGAPGQSVTLTILRDGQTQQIQVVLGVKPTA